MRTKYGYLTVRGRAFLAGGSSALVCALLMGHVALARAALLALALPLLSGLLVLRQQIRLQVQRELHPTQVEAGHPVRVDLTLINQGRTPAGALLIEEGLPYALGTRPRIALEGIRPGWRRHADYQIRPELRGRYRVGPLSMTLHDPFGLLAVPLNQAEASELVVTPRTVSLSQSSVAGAWLGAGDNRPRAFAIGSAEDVTVREYRHGDDLRRVHWRSTAHSGELMVRREEQPWQSRATIVLDNRASMHLGRGSGSSFEAAVTAAASVAVHLANRGFTLRLITSDGDRGSDWHDRSRGNDARQILESLAVVDTSGQRHFDSRWLSDGGGGGLVVAVLGRISDQDRPLLSKLRHHATTAIAVVVDTTAGQSPSDAGQATVVSALQAAGWRAVHWRAGERLDDAWRRLGRAPTASGRTVADVAPGGEL